MKKLKTYSLYFFEYLKHGDLISIIASIRYLLFRTSHKNDRVINTSIGKFFCRKNTNDFQFANYRYEWGVKKFLLANKDNFSVFIDGGACTGEYCILLTKFGIRCIAFEPVIPNYDALVKNLELNNISSQVSTFPFGLGDREMQAPFYFNPVNTGASHIILDGSRPDMHVQIRTMDSLITQLGFKPEDHIMVKLDVESMEPEAIRGASDFIRKFPNLTIVAEDKHSKDTVIKQALNSLAVFEFGKVDAFNISAKKISNLPVN